MIDEQLAAFLQDGVGIHIGTRNRQFEPNGARAISVRVEQDGEHLTVYLSRAAAARVLPDLEANGLAAVVFARPTDERACQVKGTFVATRSVAGDEHAWAKAQWNAFLDSLEHIGIPKAAATTWISDADVALRLKVTAIFEQTPGPDAGKTLA
jgi:hypothetical protein